jgi:chemotaxis protein CheX
MEADWTTAFIKAIDSVFRTMFSIEVKAGSSRPKEEPYPTYDISGIIGLSGRAKGAVAISFPEDVALKIVTAMIGAPVLKVDQEVSDAIGEIANIVAGSAKKQLSHLDLLISLPQVVVGKNHMLSGQSGIPTVVVPFASPIGEFAIEVSLKKCDEVQA